MFEGTVVSVNGLFFLQVGGKGALYGLDNQVVAKSFANEKVVVQVFSTRRARFISKIWRNRKPESAVHFTKELTAMNMVDL